MNGVVLFVLYRYLLELLGAEQVGLWSVVLATASMSRLSEFGFSGGATKFIAQALAHGDSARANALVRTAFTSVGLTLGAVVVVVYPLATWILSFIVSEETHSQAIQLVPYALVSVWLGSMSSVLMASLDGCHRADIRAILSMISSFAYLGLVFILAPNLGLVGLGLAQVGHATFMLIAGWVCLRSLLSASSLTPVGWSRNEFVGMLGYSVNFQVIAMLQMLGDPLTKMLLAKFGGLDSTAYFDMANRMIQQIRALIVSVNKVFVPRIAAIQELDPASLRSTYEGMSRWTLEIAIPLYTCIVWAVPMIGMIWIGSEAGAFCVFSQLLLLGYLVNTLSSPAYFMNIGSGDMRWNVYANALMGTLTIVLGIPLGMRDGANGVVLASVLALSFSSLVNIIAYHRKHDLPLSVLIPPDLRAFMWAMMAVAVAGAASVRLMEVRAVNVERGALALLAGLTVITLVCWFSPVRVDLVNRLRKLRLRS